jgi:hypothetical protein
MNLAREARFGVRRLAAAFGPEREDRPPSGAERSDDLPGYFGTRP